jgi:ribosomal protein L37AE/L43A
MEVTQTKMERMKCCPKCGSTNINFAVFYRPSIWKCSDCGYEGAFIIENDCKLAEKLQERYRKRHSINDEMEPEISLYDCGGSTSNQQKVLEGLAELIDMSIGDNNVID